MAHNDQHEYVVKMLIEIFHQCELSFRDIPEVDVVIICSGQSKNTVTYKFIMNNYICLLRTPLFVYLVCLSQS